ncbi:MAG: hypothetical protein WA364_30750 [Candidatus Nitrosopolaris sp.]
MKEKIDTDDILEHIYDELDSLRDGVDRIEKFVGHAAVALMMRDEGEKTGLLTKTHFLDVPDVAIYTQHCNITASPFMIRIQRRH